MDSVLRFSFVVLVLAPFVTPFLVAGAGAALARRGYHRLRVGTLRWHPPSGRTCVLVLVMAGSAVLGAYAWGLMSGFYILDPDQMCAAHGVPGDHVVTRAALPVSSQCVTSAGEGTELVPGWVNPTVFVGLALFGLALGASADAGRRALRARRRPTTSGGSGARRGLARRSPRP
ncbi:hypothetical protein ABT127_26880 [Streptomyces sp. NPDC001904]|uniref:hypothetical protein n=1 Tax=Streptomyces sp. NPDC001904 TaxID=3154531 RepID=UPI00331CEAD7